MKEAAVAKYWLSFVAWTSTSKATPVAVKLAPLALEV